MALNWDEKYEVGNSLIDSQHRQLMDLANQLHQAVLTGKEERVAKPAFDALLAYTQKHFADEEALFKERCCSLLDDHHKQHEALEEELMALWQQATMGLGEHIGLALEQWVETRLIHHMLEEDAEAAKACQGQGEAL